MQKFVYKIREDGLAVLDLAKIDQRLAIAARFLARFSRIMAVSRKGVGHRPVTKFAEAIGGKAIVGRFLPGTITNPDFPGYYEPDVVLVTDPLVDRQAIIEAVKMRIPVVALCDTFNETAKIDLIIPVNNKGRKALAMVYWVLAARILVAREQIGSEEEFALKPEDFEMEEMRERGRSKPKRR
jgi:small subunit ribosomal protein S2